MSTVADIRPWFQEDIARILAAQYTATVTSARGWTRRENESFRLGYLSALVSMAISAGINPESFLSPDDVTFIKNQMR